MIKLGPKHFLVENADELPIIKPGRPIYLDVETRSRDDSLRSPAYDAYLGDKIAMVGIAEDDDGPAYAIPLRMRDGRNIDLGRGLRWLKSVIENATEWRNHNVKFDAHFAAVDGAPFPPTCKLVCTLTLAKLLDSDRMSFDLKDLSRDLLNKDYSSADKVQAFLDGYKLPRNAKARCYALVPTDLLGFYNCDDVLHNRDLYRYCVANLPDTVLPTWEMEQQLTPVLWDMEHLGLRVDPQELKIAKAKSIMGQIRMATRVNQLTGMEFADSSTFSYGLLVSRWGLPILARNKKSGNPSFDHDALLLYMAHPEVTINPLRREVIELMLGLRAEETFCSLFVNTFMDCSSDRNYVHSSYNQIVRTGRMSCKTPNTQQFDDRAKGLILTDNAGSSFLESDASQIEFRFIAHYIKDEAVIKAYNENPDTDFHEWVATQCKIKRKPAKTVNFSTAFGAGEQNIVGQLAANSDIILEMTDVVNAKILAGEITEDERLRAFTELCWTRGKQIYRIYHDKLPTLKSTARKATDVARARGYIFNLYGRRRHLPGKAAHVAFNTLCQGSAMDLIKRRMILTAPRYNPDMVRAGITMRVNVHDAVLHHADHETIVKWAPTIKEMLETPEPKLSVPIRWSSKIKRQRWEGENR